MRKLFFFLWAVVPAVTASAKPNVVLTVYKDGDLYPPDGGAWNDTAFTDEAIEFIKAALYRFTDDIAEKNDLAATQPKEAKILADSSIIEKSKLQKLPSFLSLR